MSKQIVSYCVIFRDSNNLPMASITGDIDFCIKSYKYSIDNYIKNEKDEKMQNLAKLGTMQIVNLNAIMLDDNDVTKNRCFSRQLNITLRYDTITNLDCDISKIIKHYSKQFKELEKYEQIDFKALLKQPKEVDGVKDNG